MAQITRNKVSWVWGSAPGATELFHDYRIITFSDTDPVPYSDPILLFAFLPVIL